VTPVPQHSELASDAFLAIQKLARRTGSDVQELLTLHAVEGLLARVAASRSLARCKSLLVAKVCRAIR
jgi:hypothetical protein